MKPDRVVIGAEDPRGGRADGGAAQAVHPHRRADHGDGLRQRRALASTPANALLATQISFMNEIANVCELFGADVDRVRQAVGADRRIGPSFLFPGRRLRRQLLPQGREGAGAVLGRQEVRLQGPQGRGVGQRAAEAAAGARRWTRTSASLKGKTHRRLGPGLQAEDRRHARGAGDADHQGAAREGREGAGLRSRGDEGGAGHLRHEGHLREQELRRA